MLRTLLMFSLLTGGLFGTLTAAADPAGAATAATTSEPETAQQPDPSAEAPAAAVPSPAAPDAPTAPGAPTAPAAPPPAPPPASETSKVAERPPADPPSQTAQPAEREWYGLHLLIIDGICLGLIAFGRAAESDEAVIIGAASGITNGLVFHTFVYGEGDFPALGKGLLSVAMRGALAGGGCALGSGCGELSNPALVRLSIGIALGAAVDAAFLAYRPRPTPSSGPSVRLVPAVSQQAFGGSLVGRF